MNKQNSSKEEDNNKIPIEREENLVGENETQPSETVLNETELKNALKKFLRSRNRMSN